MTHDDGLGTVEVADTGVGIAPEILPHIFDRFVQADGGATGGLGLGLAITKHSVEAHGGTISVTSPGMGLGATFRLTLPLAAAAEQVLSVDRPASTSVN